MIQQFNTLLSAHYDKCTPSPWPISLKPSPIFPLAKISLFSVVNGLICLLLVCLFFLVSLNSIYEYRVSWMSNIDCYRKYLASRKGQATCTRGIKKGFVFFTSAGPGESPPEAEHLARMLVVYYIYVLLEWAGLIQWSSGSRLQADRRGKQDCGSQKHTGGVSGLRHLATCFYLLFYKLSFSGWHFSIFVFNQTNSLLLYLTWDFLRPLNF